MSQAAKAAGISRATLYVHIKEGKVSVETIQKKGNEIRVIDTAELMRAYGELKTIKKKKVSKKKTPKVSDSKIVHTLRQRVGGLEMQIKDLRKDKEDLQRDKEASRGREGELLGIIIRVLQLSNPLFLAKVDFVSDSELGIRLCSIS